MSILAAVAGSLTRASITVDANWGIASEASPSTTATSATRTLNVPPSSSALRWNVAFSDGASIAYSKNGGGFTTLSDEGTLAVADNDTIALRFTGAAPSSCDLEIYDNTTNRLVGTFHGEVTP
jgi:hypothetical protein